jgi:pyrroline-5-carboxylate reductase
MKILIVGGGNMGLTYAKSLLNAHIVTKESMMILEKSNEKAEKIKDLNVGTVFGEPDAYIKEADLIILAVKPQDSEILFSKIKGFIDHQQVVLSIMAGIPMAKISAALDCQKIIRAMPNLPAQVGSGMTVYTSSVEVTRIELVMVQNILNSTGKTIYVDNEELIDASTAISGSGPAYVFFYIQSLIDSAQHLGFSKSQAELLAYTTFKGTINLFNKHNFSCEEWISKVASRGGTTEAALNSFASNEVKAKLGEAYQAAFSRARELSE